MATWEMNEPVVSLRDQLAMAALQGLLANERCPTESEGTAKMAYVYADQMLKARNPKGGK